VVAEETVERRSLLEWLGTGVMLGLASPLVSCLGDNPLPPVGGDDAGSGSGDAGGGSGDTTVGDPRPPGDVTDQFPFAPGPMQSKLTEFTEYTADPQQIADVLANWTLRVDGMVSSPFTLSFADTIARARTNLDVDFHCVTGWSVYDVPWNGIHLSDLFAQAGVDAGASHVTFHTLTDIYNESLPLDVALEPKTIIAYGVDGLTLPLAHGFPMRLIIPRMEAYKSAKYVYRVELTDHAVSGFWEQRGYSYDAPVAASRLRPGKY